MKRKIKFETLNFNVTVDGNPVEVVAKPYLNGSEEKRFRVSYDGSPVHIFGLDPEQRRIALLDSSSEPVPLNLQRAIGDKLLQKIAA